MLQSRRSAIRTVAAFISAVAVFSGLRKPALPPPALDGDQSIAAVKVWLDRQGITLERLANTDGETGTPTANLKDSFRDDPVINAGGLLLPTGYCRYCLQNGAEVPA